MSNDEDFDVLVSTLIADDRILEVEGAIKSGKEASVYRCKAHPSTGFEHLALKAYRKRARRSFKNDAMYREGSVLTRIGGGKTRAARAMAAGTRFGRSVGEAVWSGHEWGVLQLLHESGLPVPRPVTNAAGGILMELFTCPDGSVAPPLHEVQLRPGQATELFELICSEVEYMLSVHVLHGDLSPYNILWDGARHLIIDFPQAVDPRFNQSAPWLLQRDLENVGRFCARFGNIPDPAQLAMDMWTRFQRGELY